MQITITVNAPEIASAIHALAKALEVNAAGTLSAKNAMATTMTVLADALEDNAKVVQPTTAPAAPAETPSNLAPATNLEGETPDKVEEKIPTVVELRAMAQQKGGTADGKKAIKALLNEFESKSISDVPEDKRAAFLVKLEAL